MLAKLEILDSTLRDGAQAEGISFSQEDKTSIVQALDHLGVSYIEAGNPGSNPKDLAFFQRTSKLSLTNASLVAFGSTRRKNQKAQTDKGCLTLLETNAPTVAIFGKSWDLHVFEVLKTTAEENLKMIEETCRFFKDNGREVLFDAEHFFDGYKSNADYALSALQSALKGGADCLVLCDTNGGALPSEVHALTVKICAKFPDTRIGVHCHNDGGLAVANSIMAAEAGARHIQGTFLGFGERSGNANLSTLIPDFEIKLGMKCLKQENLHLLTQTANKISEIGNITLKKDMPYVGRSAFAHKAGMHTDGVIKTAASFEHIDPARVGNRRRFLTSEMMGSSAILHEIKKICPEITKESPELKFIISQIKQLEHSGYQFEAAEGSVELIIRKTMGKYRRFFDLISYKVLCELPTDNGCSNTATIKLRVNGKLKIAAAEGNGPVNALDLALREALREFYPCLNRVFLIDYKVRVLESREATGAKVRVLITSSDGESSWATVGISHDIIEASWKALVDSIEYKLCNSDQMKEERL